MPLPLVSVIIPTYNGDRFIVEAVESVLNQTYQNVELIVVDDGSTDRTAMVLEPYLDRIHYVQQSNQGVAVARNRGIAVAQGELVAFLDQDDVFLPDKLALQVQCFEEQPELGLVNSGWAMIDQKGKQLANIELWQNLPQLDAKTWIVWKPVFPGALMVRRAWLLQAGGFDARFQQTSDVDLVLRLALMGCNSGWVKQVTVCYRQHETNTSRNVTQQVEELEAVLNNFFEQANLPNGVQSLEKRSRYQSLVWSACQLYRYGKEAEMIGYLEKSLQYRDVTWTETVLNWLDTLNRYSQEYRWTGERSHLIQSRAWQELMQVSQNRAIAEAG